MPPQCGRRTTGEPANDGRQGSGADPQLLRREACCTVNAGPGFRQQEGSIGSGRGRISEEPHHQAKWAVRKAVACSKNVE
jgi:hypothetical protein